jgi:hypothetical protein
MSLIRFSTNGCFVAEGLRVNRLIIRFSTNGCFVVEGLRVNRLVIRFLKIVVFLLDI